MLRPHALATLTLLALFGATAGLSAACGGDGDGGPRIVLALARGGLGDQAFNDSAYAGLQRAEDELDAEISTVDFVEGDGQLQNLRDAADGEFDLLIAIGAENAVALGTVASENVDRNFAIVDATAEGTNVTSVTFRELEGDFLVGALSALLSPDDDVAFLGGADVEVIRRIEHGWRQGALYVNPDASLVSDFVTGPDDFSGFTKPEEANAMTKALFEDGAGIVYVAAGGSALGAIEAADASGGLIITTGTDQRHLAPDAVVTSRIKDMGSVVFLLASETADDELQPGARTLDYASGAIALAPYDGPLVSADVLAEFEAIVAEMDAGNIQVEPYQP